MGKPIAAAPPSGERRAAQRGPGSAVPESAAPERGPGVRPPLLPAGPGPAAAPSDPSTCSALGIKAERIAVSALLGTAPPNTDRIIHLTREKAAEIIGVYNQKASRFSYSFKIQNHRMGKTGKDRSSSGPTSLLQAQSSQSTGLVSRSFLNISSEGRSTTSLGNVFQCLVTWTVKKFFSHIQVELCVHQFLPTDSCASAQHHREEPGSILFTAALWIRRHMDEMMRSYDLCQIKDMGTDCVHTLFTYSFVLL